jgi:hypothetical protein
MSLRDFWAAEAAALRDTSALLNKDALSYDSNLFAANRAKESQNIGQDCTVTWTITDLSEVKSLELGIYAKNYLNPAWETLQKKLTLLSRKITEMKAAGWRQRSVEEPVMDKLFSEIWKTLIERLQLDTFYIATCDGDSYSGRGDSPGWGCLFVFQWETNHYTLKDIVFGRLVGFDIINGQMAPLIFGLCNAKDMLLPAQNRLWQSFQYVETRLIWNGSHLQSDELVSVQYNQKDKNDAIMIEKVLNLAEMKEKQVYTYLYGNYMNNQSQMIRSVTLHYKFRSFSLTNRNNPEYKDDPFIQNRWRKGFPID